MIAVAVYFKSVVKNNIFNTAFLIIIDQRWDGRDHGVSRRGATIKLANIQGRRVAPRTVLHQEAEVRRL